MLVYAFLSQPKTAPGPTDLLKARERRAIMRVQVAKRQLEEVAGPLDWAWADRELQEAQRALDELEEEVKEAFVDLDNYPLPRYLEEFYGNGKALIAVTGGSGVGKSSWINAIRRLKGTDPGAAKTGVTETTKEPQMYSFCPGRTGVLQKAFRGVGRFLRRQRSEDSSIQPGDRLRLQNMSDELDGMTAEVVSVVGSEFEVKLDDGRAGVVGRDQVTGLLAECFLCDLPGVGTPNFPQSAYLRQMGIRHFDMVVLMTASRFIEAELMLVEELKAWGVPFFLVRSKIDVDVQSQIEDEGLECEIGEDECVEHTQRTMTGIKEYFKSEYDLEPVYCISSRGKFREDFDFLRLEADMEAAVRSQRIVKESEVSPLWDGRWFS